MEVVCLKNRHLESHHAGTSTACNDRKARGLYVKHHTIYCAVRDILRDRNDLLTMNVIAVEPSSTLQGGEELDSPDVVSAILISLQRELSL